MSTKFLGDMIDHITQNLVDMIDFVDMIEDVVVEVADSVAAVAISYLVFVSW